jgi:hypothetical protein
LALVAQFLEAVNSCSLSFVQELCARGVVDDADEAGAVQLLLVQVAIEKVP